MRSPRDRTCTTVELQGKGGADGYGEAAAGLLIERMLALFDAPG